ncbi:hypothetical protein GOD54_02075 [Sinorhizobium medicae]|nr:hypothetical protein [Sinorhizobium medicae]
MCLFRALGGLAVLCIRSHCASSKLKPKPAVAGATEKGRECSDRIFNAESSAGFPLISATAVGGTNSGLEGLGAGSGARERGPEV